MSRENLIIDVNSCPYVFVYGTLKRGKSNHHLLEDAEYLGDAVSAFQGVMYDYGCPALTHSELAVSDAPRARVKGELFKVTPETLYRLDRLEGHPNLYFRSQMEIRCNRVYYGKAWCYFYNISDAPLAPINSEGHYEWKGY